MKDQLIFSANNPVISNHRVFGEFILPGVAYIDLLFQFLRKHGLRYREITLKNLTIHNPLIVAGESKVVVSVLGREEGQGHWKVEIEGRRLYATAEIIQTEEFLTDDTLDLVSLKGSAVNIYPISDIYDRYQARDIVYKGFMKAEGNIYKLENATLFEASPGAEAGATADRFMFHPVLLDGSALTAMQLFDPVVKAEENMFLPLYYESFRATALINKHCYAYIPASSVRRKNEILSYSIYFFDNTGKKIGELINLTAKIVREGLRSGEGIKVSEGGEIKPSIGGNGVAAFLKQVIGSYLNVDPGIIGADLGYYNMGFDSISLLQLAEVIGNRIGEDLPPTLLFEYPNISLLADHLSNTYAEKLESLKVAEIE